MIQTQVIAFQVSSDVMVRYSFVLLKICFFEFNLLLLEMY